MDDKWKIIDHYNNYQSNGWYIFEKAENKQLTDWEIINIIKIFIKKHHRNINKILDELPEDVIQEYLRNKKLAIIKNKLK